MRPATIAFPLKDPLVGPLAAIATGVLVARYVPFRSPELLAAMAAFAALAILSSWRGSRVLAAASCGLALFCGGALSMVQARPGARAAPRRGRPRDRDPRRLRGGTARDFGRARALPPRTRSARPRAGHALHEAGRNAAGAPLRPDSSRLTCGCAARAISAIPERSITRHFLGRQDIYWTASGAAGGVRFSPGRCGSRFQKAVMDLRQRALRRIDAALSRRPLPGRHDAGDPDRPVLPTAKGLDGAVPLHRHLPRSRDLRNARRRARRLLPLLPAHLLRAGEHRDSAHRSCRLAVCAGHRVADAVRALRRGADAVPRSPATSIAKAAASTCWPPSRSAFWCSIRSSFSTPAFSSPSWPSGSSGSSPRRSSRRPRGRWRTASRGLGDTGRDLHASAAGCAVPHRNAPAGRDLSRARTSPSPCPRA